MEKVKYIEASYTQVIQFDIEDLDINWEDVKRYWVSWATLHIELKNGEVIETDNYHDSDIDWKVANEEQAFDKDFNEVALIGERQ
tara:strand:+ start:553 stop:807 length:255 start_codon:yes stop_codon:yes gene_type:complete